MNKCDFCSLYNGTKSFCRVGSKECQKAASRYTAVIMAKEHKKANSRTYNTTYNSNYNNGNHKKKNKRKYYWWQDDEKW